MYLKPSSDMTPSPGQLSFRDTAQWWRYKGDQALLILHKELRELLDLLDVRNYQSVEGDKGKRSIGKIIEK